ncbi:MAG: RluA family pseudouridine synthase [Bacteroidales bacterium]|nr:RluA family pseudouridine synthase [Bacteroidales bacterium]
MNKNESALEVREEIILMSFLLQNLKHKSRDNVKSLLRNKKILVNEQIVTQFNHPLRAGDRVEIRWEAAAEGSISRNMSILYEDDHLIVIDKHAGLLTIATDKEKDRTAYTMLSSHVKLQNPANRIFIVHRLDRDTSGVMMFAKSEKVQSLMQSEWKDRVKERTYIAVVEGKVEEPEGRISSYIYESKSLVMHSVQNPEKGDLAVTRFRTIKSNKDYSLLEVTLETGKKNQIRIHMQEIGHPVAGDRKYGASGNPIGRLGLHASVLAFVHPVTGKDMHFELKAPAKFRRLC